MVDPISRGDAPLGIAPVDFDTVRRNRGWFIGLGIAFLVLGVLAILMPFAASLATTVFLGWLMLLGGVLQAIHAVQNRRWGHSTWAVVSAIIQIVAGVLVVAFPIAGTLTLTLVFAAYFIAEGILKIVRAVQHRGMSAWGWLLFDGVLAVVLGVIILSGWPGTAIWALGLLLGINLLFGGSSMLLLGLGAGRTAPVQP
jgi:uncharacterized membrane protein HdeD (DUF308 family)